MTYRGTVRSDVVVLPTEVALPDGTEVVIVVPEERPLIAAPGV